MLTKKQERLAQRTVDALAQAEHATGDARADYLREAAGYASDLRLTFATSRNDERPDVRGRSYGYRTAMADIFAKAEAGQEIRTAFRYHMNIVHKRRLSSETLKDFGLDSRTRLQQMDDRRVAQQAAAAVGRAQRVVGGPAKARLRAIIRAEQYLAALHTDALAELDEDDRKRARTLAEAIGAIAAEIVRVTK